MTSDTRIALMLGAASSLAVAALFPYLLVVAPRIRSANRPLWRLVLTQTVRAGFTMSLLAWIGLRLGAPFSLDAPLLRAAVMNEVVRADLVSLLLAAAIGAGTGGVLLLLDWQFFGRSLPAGTPTSGSRVPRWKGLLGCFYGGIVEETLSRLFLMSILVWFFDLVLDRVGDGIFLLAGLLSAIAFAAGHLPTAAQAAPLTRPMVTRVLALNTLAGIVFGLVFWRFGLEHAMLAHFATDLVLHVLAA